jgi:hypothetical protein
MLYIPLGVVFEFLQNTVSPTNCCAHAVANHPRLHSRCGGSFTDFFNSVALAQRSQITRPMFGTVKEQDEKSSAISSLLAKPAKASKAKTHHGLDIVRLVQPHAKPSPQVRRTADAYEPNDRIPAGWRRLCAILLVWMIRNKSLLASFTIQPPCHELPLGCGVKVRGNRAMFFLGNVPPASIYEACRSPVLNMHAFAEN